MKFKKKNIFIFLILTFLMLGVIFKLSQNLINNTTGLSQKIKYLVPQSIRNILKDSLYKSKYLEVEISKLNSVIDQNFKNNISLKKKKLLKINFNEITTEKNKVYTIKKFSYPYYDHFFWGKKPPGYIENYKDLILVMSGSGELIYFKKNDIEDDLINFEKLKTNFHDFVDVEKYYERNLFGIRDITVIDDELFVSFPDPDSCDKLSILRGKIDLNYIEFTKFFSFKGCKNDFQYQDSEGLDNLQKTTSFIGQRSGGRIVKFDDNNLLFTIGDYSLTPFPPEAQNLKSLYGSLVKIDLNDKKYSILSKGLRNPQGLYFDKGNNLIVLTDHGPDGGDEVNIFDLDKEKFNNYGWPIASYGVHYKSTINNAKEYNYINKLNKGAPLKKSHKDNGFKEPLIYWAPSIGISEVIKVPSFDVNKKNKEFLVAGMGNVIAEGDMTLHHLKISDENDKVISHDKIVINERIRDMYYDNDLNKFVLLLGTTPSIGFLDLKN